VPWGVLVEPDAELRVLRWPAIRSIGVEVSHAMHGGTPSVVSSFVTVQTDRELLGGRTPGPAGLEGLTVNLDAYAEEAARPVAVDLGGFEHAGDGATEPVVGDLLRCAEDLCVTSQGAAELGLPPGSYRTIASPSAAPETVALLRRVLESGLDAAPPADPRPLATIIAARLGAKDLVPELLRLVSSPHPVVAALAKASETAEAFEKALAALGTTKPMYRANQSVRLSGDAITIGSEVPTVTSSRMTDRGQSVNSIQYQSTGAVFTPL
jgi:hypothetical protein